MSRNQLIIGIALAAVFGSLIVWYSSQSAPPPPAHSGPWAESAAASGHNVLLVTIDTLRWDRLGCYGYSRAETPNIDSLTQNAVLFRDAVTTAPLTLPSHSTIFTGLDVPHHGVRNNGDFKLPQDRTTLAEILSENGYATAAFIGAYVLDGSFGLDQGFDLYDDVFDHTKEDRSWGAELERTADEVTDKFLAWLDARPISDDKLLFAWVHYYDPHNDYEPPEPFATRFSDPYDGEIAFVDEQVGRLLDGLESKGLREKTLIVVVADHGESLGDHNEATHGHLIYDSSMHVPFIIHSPSAIPGRFEVADRVVSTLDVTPTILDLLGIETTLTFDGISQIHAAADAERAIYMETMLPLYNHGWSSLHALRRHGDKYIKAPRSEYYDIRSDPGERNNLIDDDSEEPPPLVAMLKTRTAAWEATENEAVAKTGMDPETLKKLESLGYISTPIADDEYGKRDPKDMMETWQDLINAKGLTDRGRFAEARVLVDKALNTWPKDLFALERLADIQTKVGQPAEAETTLRRMLAIKPAVNIYIWLGQILVEQDRVQELEVILQQAEVLDPGAGGILILRGDVAARRNDFDRALQLYEEAKRIDPKRSTTMADSHAAKVRAFIASLNRGKK